MKTFKQKVLQIVAKIPRGKTLSYKEVARRAGSPNAARAVGNIMRQNFDPQIPCHRVIGSDGQMHGFNRGGINAKLKLLQKERIE